MDMSNRTFLVTGGTRGIGQAIVASLVSANARVIATGTRGTMGRMSALEGFEKVIWLDLDMNDDDSIEAFSRALDLHGPIYGLVNNAGGNVIKQFDNVTKEEFQKIFELNLRGPFLLTQKVARIMSKEKAGRILNIASIWSVVTKSERSLYSASKAGLSGLTRALAAELGESGVLVNTLSPGFTNTDLTLRSLQPDEHRKLAKQVPLRRFANPAEIAEVARFLVSPLNTYITGQNIIVDGGFSIV